MSDYLNFFVGRISEGLVFACPDMLKQAQLLYSRTALFKWNLNCFCFFSSETLASML